MSTVLLGSDSPKAPAMGTQTTVNGNEAKSDKNVNLPAKTVVLIDTPDFDEEGNKIPLDKKLSEIRNAFALHSDTPAAWVEGADEKFTSSVSQVFDCSVGRPSDWEKSEPKTETKTEAPSENSNTVNAVGAVSEVQVSAEGDQGVTN